MVPAPTLRRETRLVADPTTVGAVLTVALCAAFFLYDFTGPGIETLPYNWDPRKIDWLLLLSLSFLTWYGGTRLVTNRAGVYRFVRKLRHRPAGLLATAFLAGFLLFALFGPVLLGKPDPKLAHKLQPPMYAASTSPNTLNCLGQTTAAGACQGTWTHPLGSDMIGRGMVTLLAHGARVTLVVAIVTGSLIVPIATIVGVVSAYLGGRVDQVLMHYVDIQQTIPAFLVYLILRFLFGSSLFLFVVVFGFLSWGGIARIVRSDAMRYRDSEQVDSARSVGAGHLHIVRRYFLPKVSPVVIASTTRELPALVLAQAALAFLNLNEVIVPSWGRTIANGLDATPSLLWAEWWLWVWPTLALAATVVALNLFGNTLYEILDPETTA